MTNTNIQVLECESDLISQALNELNGWDAEDFRNYLLGLQESLEDIIYDETGV